jgi:hypothetical protein
MTTEKNDTKFKLNNKKLHLTYPDHINPKELLGFLNKLKKNNRVINYSIVNEIGKSGHKHTHALVEYQIAFTSALARVFDYEGLHPEIKKVSEKLHWENTVKYHTKECVPFTNIKNIKSEIEKIDKENKELKCKCCSMKDNKLKGLCENCLEEDAKKQDFGVNDIWQYDSVSEALMAKASDLNIRKISHIVAAMKLKPKTYGPEPKVIWRPWQEELYNEIKPKCTNDRSIIWYYDELGSSGKTVFAKHMTMYHKALISTHANAYHIATTLQKKIEEGNPVNIVIINLSRQQSDHSIYQGLEMLKDGMVTSQKYVGETMIFDSPHVIVFSNFLPNKDHCSLDRWDIRTLSDDKQTVKRRVFTEFKRDLAPGTYVPGAKINVAEPDIPLDENDDKNTNDDESSCHSFD